MLTLTERLSILGSTGSIGTQSLDVADKMGYKICALTANENVDELERQIRKYKPEKAALVNEKAATELKERVKDTGTRVLCGLSGVC